MKTNTTILSAFLVLSAAGTGFAQGTSFTYQGRLNDGASPANGSYDLQFTIHNALSAGSVIAGPAVAEDVVVSNGLFTVILNFGSAPFDGTDRWLNIAVRPGASSGSFSNLTPRQPITSTPYAVRSSTASSVAAANINGTIGLAQLPNALVTNGASGVSFSGTFAGNGNGLTNVPGTLPHQSVSGTNVPAQPKVAYDATNSAKTFFTLSTNANVGDVVEVNGIGAGGWQIGTGPGQLVNGFQAGNTWTPAGPVADYGPNLTALASSADGSNLVTVTFDDLIYISNNRGRFWEPRAGTNLWVDVASSTNGLRLVALAVADAIFTSDDGGETWTARPYTNSWRAVASSASGSNLVALAEGDAIFTSTNSGVTWTARPYTNNWREVASSADGTRLVAVTVGDAIFSSADSGVTWTARPYTNFWTCVAASADGNRWIAAANGGPLYTSTDGGVTWVVRPYTNSWRGVASSADGLRLVAAGSGNDKDKSEAPVVLLSHDGGVTWQPSLAVPRSGDLRSIVSSADGSKLAAVYFGLHLVGGQILLSGDTLPVGAQGASISLQYAGNGIWQPISWPESVGSSGYTAVVRDGSGGITADSVNVEQIAARKVIAESLTVGHLTGDGSGLSGVAQLYGNNLFYGNQAIYAQSTLEFGAGLVKEANAGKIGYQAFSQGLDIVGAGTNVNGSDRQITFWAEGGSTFSGPVTAPSFAGDGSALTALAATNISGAFNPSQVPNLDASKIASGFLSDLRLSTNVALRSSSNTFTGNQIINGNVGIGTNNPGLNNLQINPVFHGANGYGLQVNKADFGANIQINRTNGGIGLVIDDSSSGNANTSLLLIRNNVLLGSQTLMDVQADGKVGIGTDTPAFPLSFASVLGDKIGLWGGVAGNHYGFGIQGNLLQMYADTSASDIAFGHGESTNFTERVRIKGNGNVGIGTNNPLTKLDVVGNGRTVFVRPTSAGQSSYLEFGNVDGTFRGILGLDGASFSGIPNQLTMATWTPHPIKFFVNGSERMMIDTSGNVGLGTSSPSAKLHVTGSAIFGDGFGTSITLDDQPNAKWRLNTSGFKLSFQSDNGGSFADKMVIRNTGEVGIGTNNPQSALHVVGTVTATAFNPSSDRNLKENFTQVSPSEVLDKVSQLDISRWNFIGDAATPHLGPMAQDFYSAFGLGTDDKHIATVDADGVALAAIQGLNQKLDETRAELKRRDAEHAELKTRLEKLERLLNKGEEGN